MDIRNCGNCDNMECAANESPNSQGVNFPCDNCKHYNGCKNEDCAEDDCGWELMEVSNGKVE